MRSDERPMASEQSRLDAAVEAYLQAECQAINGDDSEYLRCGDRDREIVRAALLTAMPVLLGEPVAWKASLEYFGDIEQAKRHLRVWDKEHIALIPLYALDLGGGK